MTVEKLTNIQGIYKINFPNGKIYIGLSQHIRIRILDHLNKDYKEHPDLPISRAINKYGIQDVEVIEEISMNYSRSYLQEREKYWIKFYNSTNPEVGYNVSIGGDGASPGWDNHQAKLNKEQLFELYSLLLNTSLTFEELGEKFNLDKVSIGKINDGTRYNQKDFTYPLRKQRVEKYELENKHDAFYNREDELQNLINDLLYTDIPMKELQLKYNIGQSTLSIINQGKRYHNNSYLYPLRKKTGNKKELDIGKLELVKELLENSDKTMAEIGAIISCSRSFISSINNGTRQKQDNWTYPLRKNRLKTGPKKS